MKRVNQHQFYQFGAILQTLGNVQNQAKMSDVAYYLTNAKIWLEYLLSGQWVELTVSREAAKELRDILERILPKQAAGAGVAPAVNTEPEPEKKIEWMDHFRISTALERFQRVFAEELPQISAYLVTETGIYNTNKLIESADLAIDEASRKVMPEDAIKDFKNAGRCLAFELPTSAGFHTMRATESVLRILWKLVIKPAAGTDVPEWKNCIEQLKKAGIDAKVIAVLDGVRDLHRNELMHPDVFLEMNEALRLFDHAKSAISAMCDQIRKITAAIPSP